MNLNAAFSEEKYSYIFLVCFGVFFEECFDSVYGRVGDLGRTTFRFELRLVRRTILKEIIFDMVYGGSVTANFSTDVFGRPFVEEEPHDS